MDSLGKSLLQVLDEPVNLAYVLSTRAFPGPLQLWLA